MLNHVACLKLLNNNLGINVTVILLYDRYHYTGDQSWETIVRLVVYLYWIMEDLCFTLPGIVNL